MIGAASVYVVEGVAVITGTLLAYRSRSHLPVAILLGFGLGADVAGELLGEDPDGWRFAVRVGLGTAYPWAVLAVAALTLRGEGEGRLGSEGGHRGVALAPFGFLLYLSTLLASGLRGPALMAAYASAQALLAAEMVWVVRGWRKRQGGRLRPATATEACAIICAATEIAQVPAYLGLPGWASARAVYAFAYLALIFVQSRALLGGIPACRISTPST